MTKKISILGSTGSVGRQALDVVEHHGYAVELLSANGSVTAMEAQCRRYRPTVAAMYSDAAARDLALRLSDTDIRVVGGHDALLDAITSARSDVTVNAISGAVGLLPSLAVIEKGERLALANKETLVIAGEYVMERARYRGTQILPVDSEHCAIHQCIKDTPPTNIRRILLTASGGPYFGKTRDALAGVTREDTLRHPTWAMGDRITVDSATLMNKGFEVIEAAHLFSQDPSHIDVIVHRESIIHSAVEYIDNTVLAQMAGPDMRACVQYALDYPTRNPGVVSPLDLVAIGRLSFYAPDTETFPLLSLASRALSLGGGMGAVLNAADEVAVGSYLAGEISLLALMDTVVRVFEDSTDARSASSLDELLAVDQHTREKTRRAISLLKVK